MSQLWEQLHDFFDTDDGSLPDIEINGLAPQSVVNIYAFLRSRSRLTSDEQLFWHNVEERDVKVSSVPNAAQLVVEDIAPSLHIVVEGLIFCDATIPALGIFVDPDAITLDYRMGPEWGAAELDALMECLRQIRRLAPEGEILLKDAPSSYQEVFQKCLNC